MVISFRVLYKLRQRSIPCVGRTAVFCGQSRHVEVERGICSVLVVGGVVEMEVEGGEGSLVCLWLGVWREARGPVVMVICRLDLHTYAHQHSRSRHTVIFIDRYTHCT